MSLDSKTWIKVLITNFVIVVNDGGHPVHPERAKLNFTDGRGTTVD